jgi:hypothetical protein
MEREPRARSYHVSRMELFYKGNIIIKIPKDIKDVHSQKTSSGLDTNKMPKDIRDAHNQQRK